MALIGDALAHAVLPGVVIGFMIAGKNQAALFFGAVAAGIVTVLLISAVHRNTKIKEDTSIGIIFTGAFALGILLVSQLKQVHIDLSSYLFGDVLGVSSGDIVLSLVIMLIILICVVLFYKQLLITSFDPTMAAVIGISVTFIHYMLMMLLSMSIVAGLQSVGVILIIAMLITPPATAYLLSSDLKVILILSSVFGILSAVIGLYLSYYFNFASGASIVLTSVLFFVTAFLFSPSEGLAIKYLKRRTSAKTVLLEDIIKHTYKMGNNYQVNELVSKLSAELGISDEKVKTAINKLTDKKIMYTQNGNYILTEEGINYAKKLIRIHRLWETYITKENASAFEDIHSDAERIEHILSEEITDELDKELGYPETDPHGSEIPR
jgi:ABC-type Mn2+/Zn2+ transport system permease subunit/Mn-dependent DtxR family transcriptional regulator